MLNVHKGVRTFQFTEEKVGTASGSRHNSTNKPLGLSPYEPQGTPDLPDDIMKPLDDEPHQLSPPPPEPSGDMRRNPPVTLEDWPDPDDPEAIFDEEDDSDNEDEPTEHDYGCIHDEADDSHAALEWAQVSDEEFRRFLERELGDGFDDEWRNLYHQAVTTDDIRIVKLLSAKLRAHFSKQTYEEIRLAFAEEIGVPSEYVAWRRLQALFQSPELSEQLCYRNKQQATFSPRRIRDIFDGKHYRSLLGKRVHPNNPYCFFNLVTDLALGLSLDGFTLFKRRRRGNSTAWPLIILNYNLPPEIRTHLKNVICVGAIPGPRQFKDLNSFLVPLLDELLHLESGVNTYNHLASGVNHTFTLHAFLILAFGDIPALSKLAGFKGHNAFSPCRTCSITGITDNRPNSHTHYVPLTQPNGDWWDPFDLPMRTPEQYSIQLAELEAEQTKTSRANLARTYGINSHCILSALRSIDMTASFPYDFMHLVFENLVPNLIKHWTGTFKRLNQGSGHYELTPAQWVAIGLETAGSTVTIPSYFVGTLPDIKEDQNLYKAEAYGFWIQYLAPILLSGRIAPKYHKHLLDLKEILDICLQYKITESQIDHLETLIVRWVSDYEAYYYQYQPSRVSACPLTIHALLHIPYYIRQTGPVWVSWAYVMERFCGSLLQAVRNRVNPYPCIDNYLIRRAQMQIISNVHGIRTLSPPPAKGHTLTHYGTEISSWEKIYRKYPTSVLGRPVTKNYPVDTTLMNQLVQYFQVVLGNQNRSIAELKSLIKKKSIVRYGRVRNANGGDRLRAADVDNSGRNSSFIRFTMFPDRNAARRRQRDEPYSEINYGQLQDIFYVKLRDHGDPTIPRSFLLARVLLCDITKGRDASRELVEYKKLESSARIINLLTVECAVGRAKRASTWGIIDRSQGAVRTLFTNEDNVPVARMYADDPIATLSTHI
ncbi:unnamed protein product, partial [Rhizoctonia solani]